MPSLGSADRPLRVAVVGAGPAGLYAAEALLKKPDLVVEVDVLERFPTPFGLVRDGVAPDHQSIKAVARVLERTLADPRVRLFGNVTFGVDLHHRDLTRHYDQIVYAVGAQADRRMSIPGESLPNSHPAISFVGWYNGHPDYRELSVDLSGERAVVVGNGNVAMDVARILATAPDELATTDIADHALAALRRSRVREIVVLGRRGAAQASFTTPELKELGKLAGVEVVVDPANIELDPASRTVVEEDRTARANLKILREYAARDHHDGQRRIVLRFLASPVEGVPFDPATSTVSNVAGQVAHPSTGEVVAGEYVVGRAKRGPTGRIGNNKADAISTVEVMVTDLPDLKGVRDDHRDRSRIEAVLRRGGIEYTTYQGWRVLDSHELALGASQGRPRVKVCSVPEMLEVIRRGA
jgi:ferredoxin/flavodoxin---NADP+ reductase